MKYRVLVAALLLAGCSFFPGVRGSGNLVTKQMEVGKFDEIDASGAFHVELMQGSTASVVITADDNVWNDLDVHAGGGTLYLGMKSGSYNNVHVSAKVTVPSLKAITFSGATDGSINGFDDMR